jgi:hypothetical protein
VKNLIYNLEERQREFMAGGSMFTLIFGDDHKPEIRKLSSVLQKYFPLVLTLNSSDGEILIRSPEPGLMILTDTLQYGVNTPIRLRNHFPEVGFLALFDRVDPEMELALRCSRTLFLGSYKAFFTHSQAIMGTFFRLCNVE